VRRSTAARFFGQRPVGLGGDRLAQQGFLVVEMVVHSGLGGTRFGGDDIHPGLGVSLPGEHRERRVEDRLSLVDAPTHDGEIRVGSRSGHARMVPQGRRSGLLSLVMQTGLY
jgi:hypothetical protein